MFSNWIFAVAFHDLAIDRDVKQEGMSLTDLEKVYWNTDNEIEISCFGAFEGHLVTLKGVLRNNGQNVQDALMFLYEQTKLKDAG